ncbi:MAG: 2-oxoacid:acceptor oxidoreductase family protein, partial [bacterium]
MRDRHEVRIVGSGGQGVVLAGTILAEAAGEYGGRHVAQTQSYGSRARGGAVTAEIVVSNNQIDYPLALCPDILVILDKTHGEEYRGKVAADGWTII